MVNKYLNLIVKVLSKGVLVGIASGIFGLGLIAFFVLWFQSLSYIVSILEAIGMHEDLSIGLSTLITIGFMGGSCYAIVQELNKGKTNG